MQTQRFPRFLHPHPSPPPKEGKAEYILIPPPDHLPLPHIPSPTPTPLLLQKGKAETPQSTDKTHHTCAPPTPPPRALPALPLTAWLEVKHPSRCHGCLGFSSHPVFISTLFGLSCGFEGFLLIYFFSSPPPPPTSKKKTPQTKPKPQKPPPNQKENHKT